MSKQGVGPRTTQVIHEVPAEEQKLLGPKSGSTFKGIKVPLGRVLAPHESEINRKCELEVDARNKVFLHDGKFKPGGWK